MQRELTLGPQAVAHTQRAVITEEGLPSHLKRVDADRHVNRVR